MSADDEASAGFSLRRWSRRKLEAARVAPPAAAEPASPAAASTAAPAAASTERAAAPDVEPAPLPPIESLDFDSDFAPFLKPKVDEALKRAALKKLFQDPRFNVMDGLDIYVGDYSLPDPISPELVRQLLHARSVLAPPKTRINAQGFVEDVPPDEPAAPPAAPALPAPGTAALPSIPDDGTDAAQAVAPGGGEAIHSPNDEPGRQ